MNQKALSSRPVQNLVVAKYRDGRMIKGVTYNFGTEKKAFHVVPITEGEEEGMRRGAEVLLSDLKAIFFVKSLEGRKYPRTLGNLLDEEEDVASAWKVRVMFHDGETLIGLTHGYSREKQGFFITPLEKESNNIRVFVVFHSAKEIEVMK